jgi:hypothetical protein
VEFYFRPTRAGIELSVILGGNEVRAVYKIYESKLASPEKLFKAVAEFVSKISPERLITVSHSSDKDNLVVAVWYWEDGEPIKTEQKALGAFKPPSTAKPGVTTSSAPPPQPTVISSSHSPPPAAPPAPKPPSADPLEETPRPGSRADQSPGT